LRRSRESARCTQHGACRCPPPGVPPPDPPPSGTACPPGFPAPLPRGGAERRGSTDPRAPGRSAPVGGGVGARLSRMRSAGSVTLCVAAGSVW